MKYGTSWNQEFMQMRRLAEHLDLLFEWAQLFKRI